MNSSARPATFTPGELSWAMLAALAIELSLAALLIFADTSKGLKGLEDPANQLRPISVTPVLDELPLLKKGGKPKKTKLPDMWKKPKPKKRYEAKSAPTPKADKSPDAIPTTDPIKSDDKKPPPPPDAAVAKQVDDDIPETDEKDDDPNVDEEGAPDGVEEGTEADPLKARAVSLYKLKIVAWLKRGFVAPASLNCETLTSLTAKAQVSVGAERVVTGFSFTPSGNAEYDAAAQRTLQSKVGQQIPPPPQNYPELLENTLFPVFSGKAEARCK